MVKSDTWLYSTFTQLVLINALIDSVNGPAIAAALATGRIKKFEIITGGLMILNLPMSYILLFWGCARSDNDCVNSTFVSDDYYS